VVENVLDWTQRNNSSADLERICGLQIHDHRSPFSVSCPTGSFSTGRTHGRGAPRIGSRLDIWLHWCCVQLELDQT
jgi:hypothetical protein